MFDTIAQIAAQVPTTAKVVALVAFVAFALRFFNSFGWTGVPSSSIHVIDGDTFSVLLNSGERIKVRPVGYDAPETTQKGGKMSTAEMRRLAKGGLLLKERHYDIYGRIVADVRIGIDGRGGSLARHMMKLGLAHSTSESGIIRFLSTLGPRLAGRGIWKNSWLGLRVTNPRVHRAAKAWMERHHDF